LHEEERKRMIQKLLFALLTIGFLAIAASFIQTRAQKLYKNKDGK
jgi:hypothetical protein